jgi:hypothetical protein
MIFDLGTTKSDFDGFDQLATLADATNELTGSHFELDMTGCRFFDANMAAPLAVILTRITDRYNVVKIEKVPSLIEAILRKNGFLTFYGYAPLEDANRTVIPFRRIQLGDEGRFEDYLGRYLQRKGVIPQMTEGLGRLFRQSIFEIFQNSVIHSNSKLGVFVCGQFFPQVQRLDFTLADAGVGIRTTVRRVSNPKISSVDAIRWALTEGNTSKTGKQPGGIGLKLLQDFVAKNHGKLQIASRMGFYECAAGEEEYLKMHGDFRGTVVNLEINTGDTKAYCLSSEITPDKIF